MIFSKDDIKNEYFNWLYYLVDNINDNISSYKMLLGHLHSRDFLYRIQMDKNRAVDGIDLRYQFGYENGYDRNVISNFLDGPCSILEMMIALSIKCEIHIMADPDKGNRTGTWFWGMIENLGLINMYDGHYNRIETDMALDRFINRQYEKNGKYGLFTVKKCELDMRSIEIWYQAMWYLKEVLQI